MPSCIVAYRIPPRPGDPALPGPAWTTGDRVPPMERLAPVDRPWSDVGPRIEPRRPPFPRARQGRVAGHGGRLQVAQPDDVTPTVPIRARASRSPGDASRRSHDGPSMKRSRSGE